MGSVRGETAGGDEGGCLKIESHNLGTNFRHARPCAGHPRLCDKEGVDGKDKPGHDNTFRVSAIAFPEKIRGAILRLSLPEYRRKPQGRGDK